MRAFLSRHLTWAMLGACLVAVWLYGREQRRAGELAAQNAALLKRNAALEDEAGRIDTVYRTDTLRLTVTRRVTDSILAVDTLIRADTVRLIVEREREACDAVVRTCEARVAVRDSIIAVKDSLLRIANQRRKAGKIFGFIPRPRVSAGLNADERGVRPGLQVGFSLY